MNSDYKVTQDVWKLSSLTYNGVSSNELGLFIQSPPTYEYPERDVSVTHIPGRNGDLIVDNGCYKNVTRTYMLAKYFEHGYNLQPSAESILNWLTSAKGRYVELTDDYESDVYRLATYIDKGNFVNYYNQALSVNISFLCKPQKYLVSGKKTIEYTFDDQETELYSISARIKNNYNYESLPTIGVCWDDTELPNDQILMLSVTNYVGKVVSNICISDPAVNENIYIDSELQSCYNQNGEDVNEKITLNGGNFPKLEKNNNIVNLTQYTKTNNNVVSYQSLILDALIKCESKYSPQDVLIAEKQDKMFISSFESLIDKKSWVYEAQSYESLLEEVSEEYTVVSFNTLLNNYSVSLTVNTDWKYIADENGIYEGLIKGTQTNDDIELKANVDGFFTTSNTNDKVIKYFAQNEVITTVKSNKSTTIYYYPSTKDSNNDPILDIGYVDLPDWLGFKIIYKEVDSRISPYEIQYTVNADTHKGWYCTDQNNSGGILSAVTSIFSKGKTKWVKYVSEQAPVVFNKLTWSTYKKAFMLSAISLSTSTSVDITYRYAAMPYNSFNNRYYEIQYPVNKSGIEPNFVVYNAQINAKGILEVSIYSMDNKWYAYSIADSDLSQWEPGDEPTPSIPNPVRQICKPNGTQNFSIYYLENIPDYSEEDSWPDWLDPVAYSDNVHAADPNTDKIYFKVNTGTTSAWYNYSFEDNTSYTDWVKKNAGAIINDSQNHSGQKSSESFYICRLIEDPSGLYFEHDRSYVIDDSAPTETPPIWLNVIFGTDQDTGEDNITYGVPENITSVVEGQDVTTPFPGGYYKWDNNTAWVKYNPGDTLITTLKDSNNIFYYIEELPEYSDDPEIVMDYITVEHTETGDNPTGINIYAKVEGYFRVSGTADWKYYETDELIFSTTIDQELIIQYLVVNENADLTDIKIRIQPRWWKL